MLFFLVPFGLLVPSFPLRFSGSGRLYGSFNCIIYDHVSVEPEPLRSHEGPEVPCALFGPTCDGASEENGARRLGRGWEGGVSGECITQQLSIRESAYASLVGFVTTFCGRLKQFGDRGLSAMVRGCQKFRQEQVHVCQYYTVEGSVGGTVWMRKCTHASHIDFAISLSAVARTLSFALNSG